MLLRRVALAAVLVLGTSALCTRFV